MEEVLSRRVCEELLEMLRAQQDGRSRSAILRSITRCIYLMDAKNPTCSPEHVQLVASCLHDQDRDTQIQALNTLRAFATQSLFTAQIQDYYPKILDLVVSSRDEEVQVAALRLLNALPVPPNIAPLLRRAVPNLVGFLQWDNTTIQVRCPPAPGGDPPPDTVPTLPAASPVFLQLQVLRLLITLSRKEELLPDILNCQVQPEFLSLMNNSQPAKLLCEMLALVEVLHGGCAKPRRPSKSPQSGSCSLYEVLFGENSHLADHLLVMFVHPEESVQLHACRLIMSLQLYKLDMEIAAGALSKHVSPASKPVF
ncbi:armadillo repeat-containing protein 12 isoform X1 [Oxyura jamaicensis]|uniref:armadillo repeat-containing protein 12 isoform X1 n=1 Tax=Oxyura jamaicensis TaxID=8884 RepID=UPI0015A6390D|nr:armadillo repeat-containing protein 12 isoform X1 [Oxyura jamaicensis]